MERAAARRYVIFARRSGSGLVSFFNPSWPLPAGVRACITTREKGLGASISPFDHFNLALHVSDDTQSVLRNRKSLQASQLNLNAIQWLQQVHGVDCIEAQSDGIERTADACFSRSAGVACAVMTADCLPVLFTDAAGTQVAAAHAGWRGLVDGILAETISSFSAVPSRMIAYLGPAIGPKKFEVGLEVLEKFFAAARNEQHLESIAKSFKPSSRPLHFYADLYALAKAELQALGVSDVFGGDCCTFTETERFYSYRKEKNTGRMASLIWLE